MIGTIFSLIPPLLAIVMVLLTRRVILSLGVGVISAALLLESFSPVATVSTILASIRDIFISDGGLNTWNVYILLFLFLLGIISAFITISGGSRAFGEWALKRVKTRVGAQIVTAFLGIIIFIDDYFNALAVGQVSRPITDRHRVSRAKLAYIIDSTSAPICVVSPISSWGAYIIGIIGTIFATHQITQYTAFSAFIQMIPLNFYVITAILLVFVTAIFNINIGSMKRHEQMAVKTGQTYNTDKGKIPGELSEDLPVSKKGTVLNLIVPIIALVIGTVGAMIYTGIEGTDGTATILDIFENTDVATALLYGGIFSVVISFILFLTQKDLSAGVSGLAVKAGIKSMLPAVYILIFAWSIVDLIGQLETGQYLAGLVENSNINIGWLPAILFVIAGIMAFSTGTSWGTFGLMLPIAGQIMAVIDVSLLLPALAAVLAGSVFGDHCSPISDTTILSSTGAGCHHVDHVITQLPYAVIAGVISVIGYIVLGLTGSMIISLVTLLVTFVIVMIALITLTRKQSY
ncbi:Na+/H+ antiporter NhaC family protein [Bacillus sp. FJAT-45350]|uniref:Na+/H+ antiporter NhaC family protein n=1 Tax=Bacillus sp. FJAT-45350 TaxID=2011014 RepID=UPI000BB8DC9B|nr:Na+/H+ antiporter NhaC family protein [Bacillus sp. FJAT-45350]